MTMHSTSEETAPSPPPTINTWTAAVCLAATSMIVSGLGPWVTIGPVSAGSLSANSVLVMVAGLMAFALLLPRREVRIAGAVGAGAAAALTTYCIGIIISARFTSNDEMGELGEFAKLLAIGPGWGLVLAAVASLAALILASLLLERPWRIRALAACAALCVAFASVGAFVAGVDDLPGRDQEPLADTSSTFESTDEPTLGELAERRRQASEQEIPLIPTIAPEPETPSATPRRASDGYRACAGQVDVGSVTTCQFAQEIRDSYLLSDGSGSAVAYSEAAGRAIEMTCAEEAEYVVCRGGTNAKLRFPASLAR